MPPVNQVQLVEPGYDESVDSYAVEQRTSYRFFRPEWADKAQFLKPKYDRDKKPLTVFRPFPCKSFSQGNDEAPAFEPYRKDPGGKNYLGYWLKRVYVAWNVGKPSISFIVHDPKRGPYDARMTPIGCLNRAVRYAVKKGQGKADDWNAYIRPRELEPRAESLLKWGGMLEGSPGRGAELDGAQELYLMQGMLLVDNSQRTYGDQKAPLGWGNNPTCVLGLTKGAGSTLMGLLNAEVEGFRGDPGDFERRYAAGDPVGPESGRLLFVYPKGGDPRQARYQSQPAADIDPTAQWGTGQPAAEKKREEVGFSCHLEKNFERLQARMAQPAQKAGMYSKWIHWDDVPDQSGRVRHNGLLWYPTYAEQAQILARVFPADMLEYAFYGEHNDWLTEDIRRKARGARSASVPGFPPGDDPAAHAPWGGEPAAQPAASHDWLGSTTPDEAMPQGEGLPDFSAGAYDAAGEVPPTVPADGTYDLDSGLDALDRAAEVQAAGIPAGGFDAPPAAPPAPPPAPPAPPAARPTAPPAGGSSAGVLAARERMRQAQQPGG